MPKPLDGSRFYILLALAERPLHGYAIGEQLVADSQGALWIRPGNLYRLLHDMVQCGLIEVDDGADSRGGVRTVYRLTNSGRQRLKWEVETWRTTVRLAAERGA